MVVSEDERECENDEESWKMYFNSASKALRHGIEAILISPKGKY